MDDLGKKIKSDAAESAEAVSSMLEAVGDKVPGLIKDVMGSLYSREVGSSMGQAVGAYYKELISAGIPEAAAVAMATSYSFSLKDLNTQEFGQNRRGQGGRGFTARHGADDGEA